MSSRPLLPAPTAPALRRAALLALLAFLPSGCGLWRAVPVTRLERGEEKVEGVMLRYRVAGDPRLWHLRVERVELPFVEGKAWVDATLAPVAFDDQATDTTFTKQAGTGPAPLRIDLRTMQEVEVYSPGRGFMYTMAGATLTMGALILIIALSKTLCPFVYVDGPDGPVLAGEAYGGATSRALQRDDLLPLPPLTGPVVRLRLTSEARETQLTDRLELLLVDHPASTRALATHDARAVLVGPPLAPGEARDLDGADVAALVRADDAVRWSTDLDAAASRRPAPAREGLVATFPALPAGALPVLELRAGNTPFLDVVLGRYYALAGDGLAALQAEEADPGRAAELAGWRAREGVDLLVETWRGGRWVRAAVVPTPGPAALRTLAVVLPPFEAAVAPRVRISGGVGFWTIDRVGLSALRDGAPAVHRLAPATAAGRDGDARPALAAVDGRYQVLAGAAAELPLSFELPPAAPGAVRDAFLATTGHYLIHRPPQAERSVATLRTLRDQPGALGRFSLDLHRGYQAALAAAPPVAPAAAP